MTDSPTRADADLLPYATAAEASDLGTWALRLFGLWYAFTCLVDVSDYVFGIFAAGEASRIELIEFYLPWIGSDLAGAAIGMLLFVYAPTLSRRLKLAVAWPTHLATAGRLASTMVAVLGVWWILSGLSSLGTWAVSQIISNAGDLNKPLNAYQTSASGAEGSRFEIASVVSVVLGSLTVFLSRPIGLYVARR